MIFFERFCDLLFASFSMVQHFVVFIVVKFRLSGFFL